MIINRIFFTGNLTADPELIEVGKSKVVNGSLANNEFYTDESNERQQITTYLDIKIWGAPAENFAKFAKQGQEFLSKGCCARIVGKMIKATDVQRPTSEFRTGSSHSGSLKDNLQVRRRSPGEYVNQPIDRQAGFTWAQILKLVLVVGASSKSSRTSTSSMRIGNKVPPQWLTPSSNKSEESQTASCRFPPIVV
jgi:hypothetical protein